MPVTNPTRDDNGHYANSVTVVSTYKTDPSRYPHFNPSDSDEMILAGEPLLKRLNSNQRCCVAQGTIKPGKIGYLLYDYVIEINCLLSADVIEGTPIYLDKGVATDANPVGIAKIAGDVTNGFFIGVATWNYENIALPEVNGSNQVICGTTASTKIWVRSVDINSTGKGTYVYS